MSDSFVRLGDATIKVSHVVCVHKVKTSEKKSQARLILHERTLDCAPPMIPEDVDKLLSELCHKLISIDHHFFQFGDLVARFSSVNYLYVTERGVSPYQIRAVIEDSSENDLLCGTFATLDEANASMDVWSNALVRSGAKPASEEIPSKSVTN